MNEKTKKNLIGIIKEQEKEIKNIELRIEADKRNLIELKKDHNKLKRFLKPRNTIQDDDIIPGQMVEDVE